MLRYLAAYPFADISDDGDNYEKMARTTTDENVRLIARQKALNIVPGDEYMYSNSNYTLLAEIVRRVSGKPLSTFADENIFGRLGMTDTHYYDDLSVVIKNRAVGYTLQSDARYVQVPTNNGTVGPAGVLTTVDDLIKWDRNFYDNKLGKGGRALIDTVLTRGALNSGEKLPYAFGLGHYNYNGLDVVYHNGGFFGFRTSMNQFPQQRFTFICLCNAKNIPAYDLADQLSDIYLANQFKPVAATPKVEPPASANLTPEQLAKFAGVYRNPVTEGLWMLSVKDGKLVDPAGGGSTLVPIGNNRFRVPGQSGELSFETKPGARRPFRMLKWTMGGKPKIYQSELAVTPSALQLAEFAGTYHSDEIDVSYSFVVRDEKLWMLRSHGRDIAWKPTFKDHFWNDEFGYVGFTRNRQNGVTGLLYSGGWIRHMRFDKRTRILDLRSGVE